jgi:hypothetical protein
MIDALNIDDRGHITLTIKHPGETGWDVSAPPIIGYTCYFVGRYGGKHTVFTYRTDEDEREALARRASRATPQAMGRLPR